MKQQRVDVPGTVERPPAGRFGAYVRYLEVGLLSALFAAIVVIGLTQIGLRNLADSSLVWADAAMRAGVLWITMLAGVLAAGQARHIKIDALLHRLPDKVQPWIQRVMYLLTALICVTLAAASVSLIQLEISMNDLAFLNVPRWAVLIIIPIGFALMGWRFMCHALVLYPTRRQGN